MRWKLKLVRFQSVVHQIDDLEAPEEIAQGKSIDLSIQFLLFWLPLLVILAWITNKPLTLLFGMCIRIGRVGLV